MLLEQRFQILNSNSATLFQYLGNNENITCFNSFTSFVGKAGKSHNPITVHFFRISFPKKLSLANLTARVPIACSLCKVEYFFNMMSQGERFSLLNSILGRIEAPSFFLFPCIGKHLGTELGVGGGTELGMGGVTLGGEL